ncbi:DUF6817 domain-containing protein [Roseicella aquatilis]|uniref:Tetratricopeptide repeat protein n=1 Tax=Roseicella aquatilis TaxID=2527868 RepID=A0A4R4DV13_9PROT|nr:tetratricopeptide repeat protein [Roseicella aquatilis]TCZ66123.1 tetratricopeptide repeat protein [Roseicella aquatilis]
MRLHPALRALLADDWARVDPELPALLEMLFARSAGEDWHKAGTFKDHLLGVCRSLTLWDQPREVRLLGLFHSVYSNEYVDLKLFDGGGNRAELATALGAEAERLIHTFCVMPRTLFTQRLLALDHLPESGMLLEREGAPPLHLPPRDVAIFAIATIADIAEQWHSWQDEIFAGYPFQRPRPLRDNWAASLWPGPLKPTATALSLLSRLARVLSDLPEEWGLPTPPIFARCTAVLDPAEEMAAVTLYWQAVTRGLPMAGLGPIHRALEACIQHNPYVGEPRLMLAQLALTAGDWDMAGGHARAGLDLLQDWGVAWDKRIAWSGWVAWARILLQSAEARRWPESLTGLNGLGLVASGA